MKACGGVQGTLAVVNNPQQQALFSGQVTTARLGEKLWVGSYEAYTKLVWIQGKIVELVVNNILWGATFWFYRSFFCFVI